MPTFPCPTCQRPVEWSAAATWRPFCCERCRLLDLGAWMTEKHAIAGEEISPDGAPPSSGEPEPDDPPRH